MDGTIVKIIIRYKHYINQSLNLAPLLPFDSLRLEFSFSSEFSIVVLHDFRSQMVDVISYFVENRHLHRRE